ncbi:MAG TPA: STAS domain-containing protein [Pilimelia sp.]|nr:STAS domain-containing protein [Pilimelia sp.]
MSRTGVQHTAIPAAPQLGVQTLRPGPGVVRVCVTGEVDLATATQLRTALTDELSLSPAPRRVEVDVDGVPFMDSAGINVLAKALTEAADLGIELVLTRPRPGVRRVLEVTGLLGAFGLSPVSP